MYRILLVCILIVLIACLLQAKHGALQNKAKHLKVKDFLRASNQWSIAARESMKKDSVQALVHASSALSYLQASRALMSDEEIDAIAQDTKIVDFLAHVEHLQKRCEDKVRFGQNKKILN